MSTETQIRAKSSAMDLTNGPVARTLFMFSLPFMLSTLLQTLYSTVDTIVVGQYLGSAGLSGVSNGSQLMQMIYMFCIGFANASQVLIAQYTGAKLSDRVQKVIGTLFYFTIFLTLFIGVICLIFAGTFVRWLDTPEEAFSYAESYIMICGGGLIFTGFYNMFSAILRGVGDSRHPLIFVVIASCINLVLDVVFIALFRWGVAGAAWATIIGQACSVVFSFVYLTKHSDKVGLEFVVTKLRFSAETCVSMLKIGIPMAIQSCAISLSFLFVGHQVNGLGVNVSAAFGVASKVRNIPGILTQGLSLGCSSMDGQNLGARKLDRVSNTVKWGIIISTIINVAFGIVFLAIPEYCFRMFTQDEAVLAYASMAMLTLVIELPARFVMPSCNALIQAQGFVSFSFITAMVDAFIGRIFFCWLLGTAMGMGAFGMFLGYTLATYLTAIPCFVYYITGLWKKREAKKSLTKA